MPTNYEDRNYWHQRFASETSFEWLASSEQFLELFALYLRPLPKTAKILHLGSGTSDLHNHLRDCGFSNVTNVDYEPLALERGQELERKRFGDVKTTYIVNDATKMDLPDKYRVFIDKSTSDAIACGGHQAVSLLAEAIRRHIEDDGLWLSLSFSPSRYDGVKTLFDVELVSKLPTPKLNPYEPDIYYYAYVLRPKL